MNAKIAILALSALTLAACAPTDGQEPGGSTSSSSSSSSSSLPSLSSSGPLPAGDFGNDGNMGSGTVYVRGYASVETVNEPFCESDCATYEYVFFNVTETANDALKTFLTDNQGNSYAGIGRIGLGCEDDGVIRYENDSDAVGRREYTLSDTLSDAILSSDAAHPIALMLDKEPLSGGAGAPACYAHFTTVKLHEPSSRASAGNTAFSGEGCKIGGCSAHLCFDASAGDIASTCEWREAYACYRTARCEKQTDGRCGWTMTDSLNSCLEGARAANEEPVY